MFLTVSAVVACDACDCAGAFVMAQLKHGAAVNAHSDVYGQTALHMAAAGGWTSVARTLLRHGADTSRLDTFGRSALDYAAGLGFADMLMVLGSPSHEVPAAWASTAPPLAEAVQQSLEGGAGWLGVPENDDLRHLLTSATTIADVASGDLTAADMVANYGAPGRPVVVRGAATDMFSGVDWSREGLLQQHAALEVCCGCVRRAMLGACVQQLACMCGRRPWYRSCPMVTSSRCQP